MSEIKCTIIPLATKNDRRFFMSTRIKLKVFRAFGSGFTIPHKNPSMFAVSAIYSAILSTFMYFTAAFYQIGEEPDFIASVTGILSPGEYLFFALIVGIAAILTTAVLSKMAYDSLDGKPDLSEALALSVHKFLPLIAMYILFYLIVIFGTVLLIIPGIFLSLKLAYSQYFILLDNKGVIESLRLSWLIVKGNWWRTLALALIWGIIIAPISTFVINLPRTSETVIYFVLYLLITPWMTSSFVNAYAQLKVRIESPAEVVES